MMEQYNAHASQFLTDWFKGHPFTLTAIVEGSSPVGQTFTNCDEGALWASQQNAAGANVYFGVNPGYDTNRTGKLSKEELTSLIAAQVDIDPPDTIPAPMVDMWRAAEVAKLRKQPFPPTTIVSSGRGLGAFWRFSADVDVAHIPDLEQINRALVKAFNGDKAAIDASRIMKLPGTTAYPNEKKRAAGYGVAPASIVGGSGPCGSGRSRS